MLVEDQSFLRSALSRILRSHAFETVALASLADVREELATGVQFDAIVSDYVLPDGTGKELIAFAQRHLAGSVPIILISGWHLPPDELPSHVRTVKKPFDPSHLIAELRSLLRPPDHPSGTALRSEHSHGDTSPSGGTTRP